MAIELAEAVNRTGDLIISDIQPVVPVRTGRLRERWGRIKRAKPDDFPKEVQVGPPPSYGINYYPFTRQFGGRGRVFFGNDRQRLFQPGQGATYQERVAELLKVEVEKAIRRSLE